MTATETRTGLFAALGAYVIWGLLPLYLRWLQPVPAADILAHRILWSVLVVAGLIALTGGLGRLRAVLGQPRLLGLLLASAAAIAVNWLVYTSAIMAGQVLDTSLGYFINPLVNVLFGTVLLGERLGRLQWAAVALAALGVAIQTAAIGQLPLVSLALALSFGVYGLIRKQAVVDAVTGLFVETLVLAPVALGWLLTRPQGPFGWPGTTLGLLALAGPLTAAPLLLFGVAARRLKLSTLGLIQYLSPSMVFVEAVLLFHEAVGPARLAAFGCIWAGLALYTVSLRRPMAPAAASR